MHPRTITPRLRTWRIKAASLLAVLLMAIGIGATGTAPAQADTYQWWVSHVYMNVGDNASAGQQAQYAGLITSLRNAAGHSWRSGVMPTQTPAWHALIRLDLSHSGATLQLWFTPDNLYLRGFTTAAGTTFTFNDYDLRAAMQPATAVGNNGLLPPAAWGAYVTLPFASSYNDLTRTAAQSRSSLTTTKVHLAADGRGLPLAIIVTPGNVNDSTVFDTVLDAVRVPPGPRRMRSGPLKAGSARRARASGGTSPVSWHPRR